MSSTPVDMTMIAGWAGTDIQPWQEPHLSGLTQGRLLIQRCSACEANQYPPIARCAKCFSSELTDVEAAGTGEVVAATVVREVIPSQVKQRPYALCIVRLSEGPFVLARWQAPDPPAAPGTAVRIQIEELADIGPAPVVVPGPGA